MTHLDEQGRPEPPLAGDETATLLGFLDYQRATLAWKVGGLDAAGLQATVAASSITLGGMLKHLAYVEEWWFSERLHGRDPEPPWSTVVWEADPWSRGGYAFFDPAFDPALRQWLARPFGRIFFAGEHTSFRWQGYMNGAVESGRRAAAEIEAVHRLA